MRTMEMGIAAALMLTLGACVLDDEYVVDDEDETVESGAMTTTPLYVGGTKVDCANVQSPLRVRPWARYADGTERWLHFVGCSGTYPRDAVPEWPGPGWTAIRMEVRNATTGATWTACPGSQKRDDEHPTYVFDISPGCH